MAIDLRNVSKRIGLEEGELLGRIDDSGSFKVGPVTMTERINRARKIGATDAQIVGLLSNSNYGLKIDKARELGASDVQIINSFIRKENPPPVSKEESGGIIRTIIKEELGAIETITAPLFFKAAEKAAEKERESVGKLAQLYKSLPEGSNKNRVRKVLEKVAYEEPIVKFEEVVPTARKSTSQALGEAVMLGLLIAPGVSGLAKIATTPFRGIVGREAVRFAQTNVIKSFYKNLGKGLSSGAAMGAIVGLAEEGELKEKIPTIMTMAGIGAIGGGVIGGILPPVVKLIGGGARNLFSKVVGKVDDKIVAPTIRYVERPVGKVKVRKAIQAIGEAPIENKINKLNKKITKVYYKVDDAFYAGKAKKEILPLTKDIKSLQKEVVKLENQRKKLLNKSIFRDLSPGDRIFNKDIGMFRVKEFRADLGGKIYVLGEDVNGKITTITPDDVLKMKKIIPQNIVERAEIIGLPKLLEQPVELGKAQKAMFGVRSATETTSKMLNRLGESGKTFVKVLDNSIDVVDRKIGGYQNEVSKFVRKYNLSKKPFTLKETKNIINILDAGIKYRAKSLDKIPIRPVSDRVRDFVQLFSDITTKLGGEFDDVGGRIKTPGKNYHNIIERYIHLPHIPKDIKALKKAQPEIVERILMKRHKMTKQKANETVNNFVKQFYARRYAGLEKSRTLFVEGYDELSRYGYETNPLTILDEFINGSVKRIEDIKMFGRNDEVIANLINQIGIDGYDKGLAQNVWNKVRGDVISSSHKELANAIKTWQVVGKLPLSAIVNSTQTVNTASEYGVKRTLKSFWTFATDRAGAEEAARLAGVKDSLMTRAMEMAGAESKVAGTFLRKVGFTSVERFNRVVTTIASQDWANDALKILQKSPNDTKLLRHFRNLGFDSDNVRKILERGRFSQDELNRIGQKAVQSTQFRGSVLDIPLFWSSDAGKVVTQFKSFAWQQGAFVKRVIIDEAAQGNLSPLITYTVLSQITGEAVKDVRSVLKGDFTFREDEDTISRLIDNQLTVGGLGLTGDLFYSMIERAKGKVYISAADFIMGPTGSEVTDFLDVAGDLLGGRLNTTIGFASRELALLSLIPKIRDIPGAGAYLRIIGDIIRTIQRKVED